MNNRKIIYEPEKISSEEIKQRRDFENIVSNLKKPPSPFWKLTGFWGTIGTSIIALLIYNNYFLKTDENKNSAYDNNITQLASSQSNLPQDTKCLKPLVKDKDVPFETFEIESNSAQTIMLEDGSVITIPSNAFLTSSNEPIEIKARTFASKSEAFVAGVPMDYEGKAFESAGMIELRGFQNGKVVEINPESPLQVSLSLYKDPSTFNFYQMNDETGAWKDYPVQYSQSKADENNSNEFVQLKSTIEKVNTEIDQLEFEIASVEFPKRSDFQLPLENSRKFNLKYDPFEFPELEELGDVEFVALPNQSNYQKVITHIWSDFKLKELKEGNYEVTFSKDNGLKETLTVRPIVEGERFEIAAAKYNSIREAKIKEKKLLENEKYELIEANKKRQDRLVQLQKEKDEVMRVRKSIPDNQNSSYSNRYKILSATADFSTSSWGLFNSDKPISYPNPIGTPSTFRLAGKKLIPNEIYVFDLKKDVRYSYGVGSEFVESLGMNNNETIFIVMGQNNEMGYFKVSDKKDFQSQKEKTLTVIKSDQINVDFFQRLLDEERVRA